MRFARNRASAEPANVGQQIAEVPAGSMQVNYDASYLSPDDQYGVLVTMMQATDAAAPAPITSVTQYGEGITVGEYVADDVLAENWLPNPELDIQADNDLHNLGIRESRAQEVFPAFATDNDDQYFGLGVPPGPENVQPFETGHSQIILPNPGGEHGWDRWSGRVGARVARRFNGFPGYNAGINRKLGDQPRFRIYNTPVYTRTQQARDLLLAELNRRGYHNVTVMDVPAQTYTEQTVQIDPTTLTVEASYDENVGIL